MQDFLLEYYNIIKALHIVAIISWMAGLLYLPRLFVYHAEAEKGSELSETLKIMERKLLRLIMNPAMVLAWLIGCAMLYANEALISQPWMHAKLTLIVMMTVFHHMLSLWRKTFVKDGNKYSHKFYRRVNEVPTLLMIGIVFLAVLKPF